LSISQTPKRNCKFFSLNHQKVKQDITKNDHKFISYALSLARKNLGVTGSNPVVGCLIVKNNEIIASGITGFGGTPHAEVDAINKVQNKTVLREAEIYVTLEPCCHFGKTPPCVDEIIKHQFRRVIIGTRDPDQRVNGQGIEKLKKSGISVTEGVLTAEAQELNRAFFKARKTQRPFVTLKVATSLDGKIATKDHDSKWITNESSRKFSHYLRSINNAILVGSNTVRKDNPLLNCRISGLENHSPIKIIVSSELDLDPKSQIFANGKIMILTNKKVANNHEFPHSKLIFCPEKNGKINLDEALKILCHEGINSLLVEGGSSIATQFLQENLVDELIWIRSSKIIGNEGISAIGTMNFSQIAECLEGFRRSEFLAKEEDLIEIYRKI
jgi:diaminohydroxyphosphoribosylaminopyrimidine deaminase/5-amino-6-(5-phosphoribosylamino)uracil reductase